MKTLNKQQWEAKYLSDLRELPTLARRHERNPNLLRFAHHALRAGRTIEQSTDEIIAASGRPPLSEYEVRRALENAAAAQASGADAARKRVHQPSAAERGFVEETIHEGWGYTEDDIKDASPHLNGPIHHIPRATAENRSGAASVQISAMLGTDTFGVADKFWVGCDQESGCLVPAWDILHQQLRGDVPCFITSNALTGALAPRKNKTGLTVRGDACVVAAKLLLIEFDALTLEEQYAFWGRVLEKGFFDVASIVYSGGKSLHGLIRVEGDYARFRERVIRFCCSARDPRYRADRAVLHSSALTRLAGAERPDTGKLQELVWADVP